MRGKPIGKSEARAGVRDDDQSDCVPVGWGVRYEETATETRHRPRERGIEERKLAVRVEIKTKARLQGGCTRIRKRAAEAIAFFFVKQSAPFCGAEEALRRERVNEGKRDGRTRKRQTNLR
jgi:hypothetical protein